MIEQMGFCNGIEKYSRNASGRAAGAPPPSLIDYFPEDFLLTDESHLRSSRRARRTAATLHEKKPSSNTVCFAQCAQQTTP